MSDSDSDKKLFRDAVAGAEPLRSDKVLPQSERPRPVARFTREDEQRAQQETLTTSPEELELEAGDQLSYRREDVKLQVLKNLRRGKYRIQEELDLHGLVVVEAKTVLEDYIRDCRDRGLHCVRVIHGKGIGSGQKGPVLKGKVNLWLRRHKDVAAFVSAPGNDGGTGAVYVLLD